MHKEKISPYLLTETISTLQGLLDIEPQYEHNTKAPAPLRRKNDTATKPSTQFKFESLQQEFSFWLRLGFKQSQLLQMLIKIPC
jgi:hypothetical protein